MCSSLLAESGMGGHTWGLLVVGYSGGYFVKCSISSPSLVGVERLFLHLCINTERLARIVLCIYGGNNSISLHFNSKLLSVKKATWFLFSGHAPRHMTAAS